MLIELLFLSITIIPAIYLGIEFYRKWSLKKNILDLPNERSSHSIPTPRGAGTIIGVFTLTFYCILQKYYGQPIFWGYLSGGAIVFAISFADDLKSISAKWRFVCHSLAAILIIINFWVEGGGDSIFSRYTEIWFLWPVAMFLWIVWCINAYNFMDGIDGLAGLQALMAGFGWLGYALFQGMDGLGLFSAGIGLSALAFLLQNWSPAKIFLGDAGSAFWGFTFAVLPFIYLENNVSLVNETVIWGVTLIWPFIFDTVYTFFIRLCKKEKVWKAHREHIYQRLVINGLSHRRVAIIYGFLSLIPVPVMFINNEGVIKSANVLLIIMIAESLGLLLLKNLFEQKIMEKK